jgi:type I restriction enzyme S subunit
MLAETRSGTFPQITFDHLKTIDIFVPKDEKILQSISKIFINILKKTFKNWSQIRTLSNLRDTLLPKLMSGEIRIALDESTKKKSEQPIAIGLNEPRMQHPQP